MIRHPQPSASASQEVLSGLVVRVVFHKEETGFCVLKVRTEHLPDLASLVANTPSISVGEWIEAVGYWQQNRAYGLQFSAERITISEPTSLEGIERYLASGMIHGIGSVYAKKLIEAFGEEVLNVIEHSPERLLEVPGIGKKRSERITAAWFEQRAVRKIMVFLHSHGVGAARATHIYRTYGDQAIQLISENPYRLINDIRGIGFRSADLIAMRLGVATHASARILAAITHTMTEAHGSGHCGFPREELSARTAGLLDIAEDHVVPKIDEQLQQSVLMAADIEGKSCLFTANFYRMELEIAERFKKMTKGQIPWPEIATKKALEWVKGQLGFDLAESQSAAVAAALKAKLMIITGGPGVGKTTIMLAILRILMAKKAKILLCAPTGRSAKRMQETTHRPAKTIHRLLEMDPASNRFIRDADYPLDCDLIIVDESSMVDVALMHALIQALPEHAALLMVGDIDQLPSVGPGQVLADTIHSEVVPVVRLVEVFRQAAHSQIVTNAHRINIGQLPDFEAPAGSDFFFVPASTPSDAANKIHTLVTERIPKRFGFDPIKDIQVLCPMRRGLIGTHELNSMLQATLNPPGKNCIERLDWSYVPGDKVMQTVNNYEKEVYNGDIGQIKSIDLDQDELSVIFDQRLVTYRSIELDALVPAYAVTIHKSQGSEYSAVIIPMMKQHRIMLERSLLYTGITRGKNLVVLVGDRQAVAIAVHSAKTRLRWTRLRSCLLA